MPIQKRGGQQTSSIGQQNRQALKLVRSTDLLYTPLQSISTQAAGSILKGKKAPKLGKSKNFEGLVRVKSLVTGWYTLPGTHVVEVDGGMRISWSSELGAIPSTSSRECQVSCSRLWRVRLLLACGC